MIKLALGTLLHYANLNPIEKGAFYPIKKRILLRWGTAFDNDLQLIPGVQCRSCERGLWYWEDGHGNHGTGHCWHCDGTTWFKRPTWVLLKKYRLGKFVFHLPVDRFEDPRGKFRIPVTYCTSYIRGYMQKGPPPKYHLSTEACLWLYLLFDRKAFRRHFVGEYDAEPVVTPILFIQNYRWMLAHN